MPHNKAEFWTWFRDKVVPSMVVAICLGMFATYIQVVRLIDAHEVTKTEIAALKVQVSVIQEQYVRRTELLEIMKRVEQQLEIVLLKAREKNNGKSP